MPRRSTRLASKPKVDYVALNKGEKVVAIASRRRRTAKVSQPMKNAIQKIINKNLETKLVISSFINQQLTNTIRAKMRATGVTNFANFFPCIPGQSQTGTATNDIIGAKTKIVSLKTYLHFNLAANDTQSDDIMVKVFFLISRNAKNLTVANTGLPAGNLLRTGAGQEQDWVPASGIDERYLNQLPLNTLSFTGTSRTFRLSKNPGQLNGGTSSAVPVLAGGAASYDFSYDWKVKGKVLKYDESDGSLFPENYLPLVCAVAWYPDGTSVGPQDSTMPVFITASNHLYFKDA